jgi:peptidoglycan/LPS O-acetylase OafA/YrhL
MPFSLDHCAAALMQVLNMTYVSPSVSLRLVESWGAGAGDLGEYDDCIIIQSDPALKAANANVDYCWVGETVNSAVGLCVPKICTNGQILVSEFELFANILHIPVVAGIHNSSNLQAQCGTHDSNLSIEGKLVIVVLVILFAMVVFASVDAWKVELTRLLKRGWDCFDIKAQEDAGDFIASTAPSPVQSRYRPNFRGRSNNNNHSGHNTVIGQHRPRKPNQHQSDTDGEGSFSDVENFYNNNNNVSNNNNSMNTINSGYETGGFCTTILQTFSLRSNYNQLVSRDLRPLAPLHAIRVLAVLWIVLGNTVGYMVPVLKESNGFSLIANVKHSWGAQIVIGSYFAVDLFFVLSGFFAGHSFIVQLKTINRIGAWKPIRRVHYGCIDIPRMYIYRFLRIVPSLSMVMFLYIGLTNLLNPGPLHYLYEENYVDPCRQYWWANLLLINNFVKYQTSNSGSNGACMDWTWYLAVDFNLYLLAPLYVLLFWKNRNLGIISVFLTMVLSISYQMYVGMKLEYSMNPLSNGQFDVYRFSGYDKPWTRCIPYLMGLAAAMMFHRVGSKIRLNRCFVIGGYAASIVLFIAVVIVVPANYFNGVVKVSSNVNSTASKSDTPAHIIHEGSSYENPNWTILMCVLYSVFSHVIVASCCTFWTFIFVTGHGGFIRRALKWYIWTPLSRLSFGVYLVHPILINLGYTGAYALQFYEPLTVLTTFITMSFLSGVASFVLYMTVEKPAKHLSVLLMEGCSNIYNRSGNNENHLPDIDSNNNNLGNGLLGS